MEMDEMKSAFVQLADLSVSKDAATSYIKAI